MGYQKKKTLYMETTKIEANRTVAEIQTILGQYGAQKIMTEFSNGEVSSLSFAISIDNKELPFRLPCRWEAIYNIFRDRKSNMMSDKGIESAKQQAKRVAWRQILRWIESQLALVQTDMVKIQEVFLPYMMNSTGQTLYETLEGNKFKMLENKSKKD